MGSLEIGSTKSPLTSLTQNKSRNNGISCSHRTSEKTQGKTREKWHLLPHPLLLSSSMASLLPPPQGRKLYSLTLSPPPPLSRPSLRSTFPLNGRPWPLPFARPAVSRTTACRSWGCPVLGSRLQEQRRYGLIISLLWSPFSSCYHVAATYCWLIVWFCSSSWPPKCRVELIQK